MMSCYGVLTGLSRNCPRHRPAGYLPLVHFTAIMLSVIALAAPATAQLRFRANSPHASMWRQIYIQLPSVWKAHRVVYIREISDEEMDRFVERFEGTKGRDDSVVDGCYEGYGDTEQTVGRITLRTSLHGDNASLVFVHEYGHYVWSNILTNTDRAHYRRIWREQKREGNLVTEYAGENEEEGFAEAYAYFIRKGSTLRQCDVRSWSFLNTVQAQREDDMIEGIASR